MVGRVSYSVLLYLSLIRSFDIFKADFGMSFMNFVLIEFIDEAGRGTGLFMLIWLNRSDK